MGIQENSKAEGQAIVDSLVFFIFYFFDRFRILVGVINF